MAARPEGREAKGAGHFPFSAQKALMGWTLSRQAYPWANIFLRFISSILMAKV
jgi:hypothetical protein